VRNLPRGTVTFLFTDVEGSTRLLHELGDGYAEVLDGHRRALRESFERYGGIEVDTQGDAFFVAFAKASDALSAAAAGRSALEGSPIRVRMGLHTGEPLVTDDGYVGIDVHRAARIAAAGHGGQILLSQSTRDLVGAESLRDLGEHRLKDLTAPERIYQLGDADFAPLKSLNTTNLPVASNPLVGRERELDDLQKLLLNSVRLVTVTGPGGSGKTRLALQVGAELLDEFSGGVFFVALGGVGQPELVHATIAGTIGVRDPADLGDRKALLVLDNFEHLLEAAPAVGELLAGAPNTKILATSRAPLRLAGEREYPLDPLPSDEAVELLTQRGRAVRPGFEPDDATREICSRLDGLPLALELAASRLRSLSSEALLQRLEQRLPLLTGGRRDAPARQRTLRATIEWSYELLSEGLKQAFARLAVFAGTFSLDAAEAVTDATFDDLDALVEASLMKPIGGNRFLMLPTIREFATGALGEDADLDRRHAEHYRSVAESTNLSADSQGGMPDHELALAELDNFRKALTWAVETRNAAVGLQTVIALEQLWVARDPFEGRRWLEALMERAQSLPPELRARSLLTYGGLVFIVGEFERGSQLYEDSLAEYRSLGDERGAAGVLNRMVYAAITRDDLPEARALASESLEANRRFGNTQGEAVALGSLAEIEWQTGNRELAVELAGRSAELAATAGFHWWRVAMLSALCEWSLVLERRDEGERLGREALGLAHQIGDRMHTIYLLALLAWNAIEEGRLKRAGFLWGAVEAEEQRGAVGQWESERDQFVARMVAFEEQDFEEERERASRSTAAEAVDYALGSLD
jgi:predicted ATPase